MKRILLAVVLVAAPAFAHGHHEDDDDRWEDRDDAWEHDAPAWSEVAAPVAPDDFQNAADLAENGRWIDTPEYGVVWQPIRIAPGWQPYRYGRWVWTDVGWTWASDEPFGWAVYHYGRWAFSPAFGWYWIPGHVWAPAWVEWRFGDRYAGWCALGPAGVAVVHPARWVWVETTFLLEPVPQHVVSVPRPFALSAVSGAPGASLRAGPPLRFVERAVGRAVVPVAAAVALGSRSAPVQAQPAAQPHARISDARREPWDRSARLDGTRAVAPRQREWNPVARFPARVGPAAPRPTAVPQPRTALGGPRAHTQAPAGFRAPRIVHPQARRSW